MATELSRVKTAPSAMASAAEVSCSKPPLVESIPETIDENAPLTRQSSSGSPSPERDQEDDHTSRGMAEVAQYSKEMANATSVFLQPQMLDHKPRARNRSPYSRSHLRSQSAASALAAPSMARARSSPSISSQNWPSISPSHSPIRPSSPMRSPGSARVTPRRSFEEQFPPGQLPSFVDIEVIEENEELDLRPRALPERDSQASPVITSPSQANALNMAFPRPSSSGSSSRRRPHSPLHLSQAPLQSPAGSVKFNEPFPGQALPSAATSSSMPSTPTSFRSRSPSVTSLEIIEDTPEAEEEAAEEAFNLAKLKAAAEEAEDEENKSGANKVTAANSREKRKRWSVCGAERRGDFEMETIWEDSAHT